MNAAIVGHRSHEIKDGETEVTIVISHRSEIAANDWQLRAKG